MFTGVAACVLYSIAWVLLLLSYQTRRVQTLCYIFILSAFCMHLDALYRAIDTPLGQNLCVFNVLSLIMALWVGIVGVANLSTRLKSLFVVILPLTVTAVALMIHPDYAADGMPMRLSGQPWILSHILVALLAYALLGVAFVQALTLGLQRWYLAHAPAHRALPLLPPLEAMQNLMIRIFMAGFLTLTAAILLGWVSYGFSMTFTSLKNAASVVVWGMAAFILLGYYRAGLPARIVIVGIALVWIVLSIAYVGMKL